MVLASFSLCPTPQLPTFCSLRAATCGLRPANCCELPGAHRRIPPPCLFCCIRDGTTPCTCGGLAASVQLTLCFDDAMAGYLGRYRSDADVGGRKDGGQVDDCSTRLPARGSPAHTPSPPPCPGSARLPMPGHRAPSPLTLGLVRGERGKRDRERTRAAVL